MNKSINTIVSILNIVLMLYIFFRMRKIYLFKSGGTSGEIWKRIEYINFTQTLSRICLFMSVIFYINLII